MITLVPEAWQDDDTMSDLKRAYYQWSSFAMEVNFFVKKGLNSLI